MELDATAAAIAESFRSALVAGRSLAEPLDELLAATGGRATGVWRRQGGELHLLGFRAVPDMPAEVRDGFAQATRIVSLSQTGLGIVKAALQAAPAAATVEPSGGLNDSATWLERFASTGSLAVPIRSDGTGDEVVGVLAISSADELGEGSAAARILITVAEHMGRMVSLI